MKPATLALISAGLLAVVAATGAAYFRGGVEAPDADSPQASTIPVLAVYTPPAELAPAPEIAVAPARDRNGELALAIERALVARDPQQRETAFNFILPELLDLAPERVIAMVARQEPGGARDALRDEVARQWITKDRDAAIAWMMSLEDEAERVSSATIATRTLAAIAPAQAIHVADQFGIGRDDGSLEHMVQIWATEKPDEAMRWLATQPDDQHTAQLRARIEQVRGR